jgi:hypothetical protein
MEQCISYLMVSFLRLSVQQFCEPNHVLLLGCELVLSKYKFHSEKFCTTENSCNEYMQNEFSAHNSLL